ncbi:UBN2 domain-containing protein, partial [Cephalotus follicularis]
VTYEGTNQVKEAKISMLVHEYEMFTTNENEDIKSMFSRFTNIINALQALDKTYSNSEMDLLKKKKKAMIATWDDSDESSSDEDSNEEVAQIALMALEEEEEEEEESDEVEYDEL